MTYYDLEGVEAVSHIHTHSAYTYDWRTQQPEHTLQQHDHTYKPKFFFTTKPKLKCGDVAVIRGSATM
jgi:hypothetical protein